MGRDQWPLEVHGMEEILDEGIKVEDVSVKDLLNLILLELKIMNRHLAEITDEEIQRGDIEDDT